MIYYSGSVPDFRTPTEIRKQREEIKKLFKKNKVKKLKIVFVIK